MAGLAVELQSDAWSHYMILSFLWSSVGVQISYTKLFLHESQPKMISPCDYIENHYLKLHINSTGEIWLQLQVL